ncbi:hypothetical protein PG984_008107 [Apiospora sp. TS-2023a]
MSGLPGPYDNRANENTALIHATLRIIQEAARILKNKHADDDELHEFYSDLRACCLIITDDHLQRIADAGIGLSCELFESITKRVGAIVSSTAPVETRLRELHDRWIEVHVKDNEVKIEFIRSILAFGDRLDRRNIIDFLKQWEKEFQSRYPEDRVSWIPDDLVPRKWLGKPSFAVDIAAEEMFKALDACQACECLPAHYFGAILGLGTYRKSKEDILDGEGIDFDMFISAEEDWQEVRVHTTREVVAGIAVEGQAPPVPPRTPAVRCAPVKRLCKSIENTRRSMVANYRLELKVMQGRMFKLQSKRSNGQIDPAQSPVTLYECLQRGPPAFSDKTKRILSVLLGYAVLHFQNTPWLKPPWSSSTILFFRTSASQILLRPFLQTNLSRPLDEEGLKANEQQESQHSGESDEDEFDPDDPDDHDDLMPHPFPTIVILAITLLEVYFVTPFPDLAKRFNVPGEVDVSNLTKFLSACHVFRACQEHMSENVHFFHAVQKCLDPKVWQDEYGNGLGIDHLRSRIYGEIVAPLENDLNVAYSSISIEKLDQVVQTLNLGSWPQEKRHQPEQGLEFEKHLSSERKRPIMIPSRLGTPSKEPNLLPSHPYSCTLPPSPAAREHHLGMDQADLQLISTAEIPSRLVVGHRSEVDDQAPKFFDDETPLEGHSPQAYVDKTINSIENDTLIQLNNRRQRYLIWKSKYRSTYNAFISDDCITPSLPPVKIAVLDTGVDLNHPDILACAEKIKAKRNWLRDGANTTVPDLDGHGTFVTSLLLDFAPDADIYIAKIADRGEPANPLIISNAIKHAVDVWKVDMISMSFGFPTCRIDGYGALEKSMMDAYAQDVLLFAAASNSGAQHGRAYPARDANVVCVNSVNVHGNRSAFSPTAPSHDISLATVGEAVESAWPVHLCSEGEEAAYTTVKSGTSYATPIMAGIAAFLLTYSRLHLPEKAYKLRRRSRMVQLLWRIAQKDDGGIRDGYHFIDVRLNHDSLFGKDKVFIDRTIGDILDG